jgi:hypothetical protein
MGISEPKFIIFPSRLNCKMAKSAYLKKPRRPILPTSAITKNIFFLAWEFAVYIALPV